MTCQCILGRDKEKTPTEKVGVYVFGGKGVRPTL